jgi:hypothetical protein
MHPFGCVLCCLAKLSVNICGPTHCNKVRDVLWRTFIHIPYEMQKNNNNNDEKKPINFLSSNRHKMHSGHSKTHVGHNDPTHIINM